jgi:hypothetical protein
MPQEELPLLHQARQRASKLMHELQSQFDEMQANSPAIAPEQLQQGRVAMQNAIAAAQRTLAALDGAHDISSNESQS